MSKPILYCHCAYARVVPEEVKSEVLAQLAESGRSFEAVPDLCEMSARKDPRLKELAALDEVVIAACYPRAIKWLFSSGEAPIDMSKVEVLNMREESAEQVVNAALGLPEEV